MGSSNEKERERERDKDITLTDLFDVDMLQRMQDAFSNMTGLAAVITDANGVAVTKGSNFTDFCALYTRANPIGCLRCQECDKYGAELALRSGASVPYYCHAGLMDFAAPIMAGERMIGCFVGGQVLTEAPDIIKVMQSAGELKIDLIKYLQAVMKVRILDKDTVERHANFLYTLTDVISSIAYHKYKMEEANIEIEKAANMKSDFLANMSHELRTPMNAVIGMTEMALRKDMSVDVREYLNQIRTAGKTLLTIINDILDFSKIESGKMDIIESEFEPLSLIHDISTIMVTRIEAKETELLIDINPNMPRQLYGDNNRIKQVIINLANNAAKFTKEGKVTLKFSYRRRSERYIDFMFSVEDTGIGIKEHDLDKIFQSFRQVDSKRNRNIEGTGLGLAICRQLISLMNGSLSVKSEYGKGSCFSFEIPLKIVDEEPCLVIQSPNPPPAFGVLENEYADSRLKSDMRRLGIPYTRIEDIGDIEALKECILPVMEERPFLFVDKSALGDELLHFVEENPQLTVVSVNSYSYSSDSDLQNVLFVKKPVSAMMITAIYNHEEYIDEHMGDAMYDFMAETAKVLIVDDNTVNLTVAEGLLEPLGMEIDTALSGKEAIEKISETSYDLILMDHMMPEIDGVETTRIIRRFHKEYDNVPIIALTANAVGGVKNMFLEEGMNDFIAKPIEVHVLMNKVKQWLPKNKITKGVKRASHTQNTFPQIEGIDTAAAIRMLGNEEVFWSILKDYCRIIPQKVEMIQEYYDTQNWKGYTIEVHALKSSSRQIGATVLAKKAELLEKAGNELDIKTIHADTWAALDEYRHYYEILSPYFPEVKNEATEELTQDILFEVFSEIENAIEELDMDLLEEAVHRLGVYKLDGVHSEYYNKMRKAVDDMDAYACEDIMKEWKEALSE
jgi:signal transduction histidine kinase/CheY-like chemotaxis protein/HPt (histidine-containing phosphotransfer) domain-containing protein